MAIFYGQEIPDELIPKLETGTLDGIKFNCFLKELSEATTIAQIRSIAKKYTNEVANNEI